MLRILVEQRIAPINDGIHLLDKGLVVRGVREVEHDGPPEVQPLQKRPHGVIGISLVDLVEAGFGLFELHAVEAIEARFPVVSDERFVENGRRPVGDGG